MAQADPRELQALQFYLNEYGQQAEIFTRQLELIEQRRIEALAAIESIKSLNGEKEPVVLVPLGGGATVRARVEEPGKVLVNIGADTILQRTDGEAVTFLQDRITEMEAMEKKVAGTIDQLRGQINEIAQRIDAAYGQSQQPPSGS
ncbi:MAG: prefoldin subunit alpha [Methanomicrobiales archaeon]|nr:Prefoldin, subunit alpha [Methanomicrobiales archaeon]MBS1194115.1 Prefoldin, subunit alpha [Methanomicrobia archaeon]MBS1194730.1 Prefoldin, subunit alpha [Methanomicrobia archaeon]MDD1634426.1 prefoldin subunit alpha [Methanomicrobiales archaeon]MDD1638690.1 prefoldin subunit alpha [Methanomicrobiales archaeon]